MFQLFSVIIINKHVVRYSTDQQHESVYFPIQGARGGARRGGATFDGAGRGARSQRFNKFEGKGPSNETSSFEQGGEGWSTGSTRGRGGQRQGNFEGGRGLGNRGRGRGGRGNFSNRADDDAQQNDNNNNWQQSSDSQFDQDVSSLEPDNTRRNNRGSNRPRPNRNYDQDSEGQDYRANRRQFDRQPRSFTSSVKAIEKKDGEGAHNWGNPTENPEEHPVSDEITETTAQSTANKDWATQVDEAEKQMTLDEYKKQVEEKKRAHQEKVPQFKRREAGEGEDPKQWHKFEQEYRKKNGDDDEDEDEDEEEEEEAEEEYEEEQAGKKKIITIPLRFKPIDSQRGSGGSRGGQRRGGNRYRSNRDDQQPSTSPNQGQQQSSSSSSQQYDDQQRSYRGARNSGDQRRPNRGGYRQGRGDPNAPALDNPEDFPTLPKQ